MIPAGTALLRHMRTQVAGSRRGRPSLCRTARLRKLNSSQLPRHANCKDRRWFFNIRSTFFSTLDWETANNNAFKFAKMQILNLICWKLTKIWLHKFAKFDRLLYTTVCEISLLCGPAPHIFRPKWGPKDRKKISWRPLPPPPIISGPDWPGPPLIWRPGSAPLSSHISKKCPILQVDRRQTRFMHVLHRL